MDPTLQERIARTTVLIPAAGRVPEGLVPFSSVACPAMLPVGGRPVIYWTMSYLLSLGLRKFIIAVAHRHMFVEDFVNCTFGHVCDVTFIVPTVEGGVGRTVFELSTHVESDSVLVVLGDTHFQFADAESIWTDRPAVLVSPVADSYRWCTVEADADGFLTALHDKEAGLTNPVDALIGVYYFPSAEDLRISARAAMDTAVGLGQNAEIADILHGVAVENRIRVLPSGDWLDCGNPDRQASSHRALLQKRIFNELRIDSVFGTITKRSSNSDKFLDEINYLRLLPPDLAILFPRIVDVSTDWPDLSITTEYYGYPNLADIFVFENVNPSLWEQIFLHLYEIIVNGFQRKPRPIAASAITHMYLEKTRSRLASVITSGPLSETIVQADYININNIRTPTMRILWPQIENEVERLANSANGCIIHGDLCLSNILYDLRSRIVKLVDPRGRFGDAGIYGDPRYDVAKLYHSVYGLYDFIVNDLFHLAVRGDDVHFHIYHRPEHQQICRLFEQLFFKKFRRRDIMLITGLLFASMPALHYDVPSRQAAMTIRSLQLLNQAISDDD